MNRTKTFCTWKPATGHRHDRALTGPARIPLPAPRYRLPAPAFTLIELMVVIAVIILVTATALPTLTSLFTSGQDAQAYNLLSAQLDLARALAILNSDYAAVHVQMASDGSDFATGAGKCYSAIFVNQQVPVSGGTENHFILAEGYEPRPLPGSMAFGNVCDPYVAANGNYNDMDGDDLADFTNFTIIFNAQGEVVRYINGGWRFSGTALFHAGGGDFSETQLWHFGDLWTNVADAADHPGATCVTIFDYKVLRSKVEAGGNNAAIYLNEYGQFLALNLYTGKFFHRY